MEKILSYQMRVNKDTGQVYKGSLVEIENSLKAKQDYVNYNEPHGLIQVICIEGIDIIGEDESKLKQFPPNRVWLDEAGKPIDIFCGNILAVRHNNEGEFTSIRPEDISTINKYLKPVIWIDNKLMVISKEARLEEYRERDELLATEPYKTINENGIDSVAYENNIATIEVEDSEETYQFQIEFTETGDKISKITYIDPMASMSEEEKQEYVVWKLLYL